MLAKHLEKKEQEGGFTLVELLVVILIIGILAAVAIPAFLNQRQRANDAAVESDVKNLATQIESALIAIPNATNIAGTAGPGGTVTVTLTGAGGATETATATLSDGVSVTVAGNTNGYTINGSHVNGAEYNTGDGTSLEYDSADGGLAN